MPRRTAHRANNAIAAYERVTIYPVSSGGQWQTGSRCVKRANSTDSTAQGYPLRAILGHGGSGCSLGWAGPGKAGWRATFALRTVPVPQVSDNRCYPGPTQSKAPGSRAARSRGTGRAHAGGPRRGQPFSSSQLISVGLRRVLPLTRTPPADGDGPELAVLLLPDLDRDVPPAEADPPVALHVNVRVARGHELAVANPFLELAWVMSPCGLDDTRTRNFGST